VTVNVKNKDGNPFMPQVKHDFQLASLYEVFSI